jgi:hypothetical protein
VSLEGSIVAYTSSHLLLTVNGTLGLPNPLETWTFGLRFWSNLGGTSRDDRQALVDAAMPATVSFFGDVCAGPARLTYLKLAEIGLDGGYPNDEDAAVHEFAEPVSPGPTVSLPFQVALAITTETGHRRGLAHRGRFYIPIPKFGIAPDGRISAGDAMSAANAAKTWINAMNALAVNSGGPDMQARVFSPQVPPGSPPLTGVRPITGVSVGRVPDTIRSRRTSELEDRQTVSL